MPGSYHYILDVEPLLQQWKFKKVHIVKKIKKNLWFSQQNFKQLE
jgi:hypothetical protein